MTMITAGIVGASLSAVSGIFGAISAGSTARAASARKRRLEKKLKGLEDKRQEVINPFEDVTSLAGMLSNPMAQLSVATQAAEMQIEQADISLANTLDTVRSTGAGAGGATALAQAALQSKKGVSASIEAQEAQNDKMRAQGEANLQQQKMSEAQRIQSAEVSGKQFVYNEFEKREIAELDRVQSQIDGQAAAEVQARSDQKGAITGMFSAMGGVASSYMSATGSMAAKGYSYGKGGKLTYTKPE